MYFECKSCGSNAFIEEQNRVVCKYCGSNIFIKDKVDTVSNRKERRFTYILLGFIFMILILISIEIKNIFNKNVEQNRETEKVAKSNSAKISPDPSLYIDNSNAQIGTQNISINSNNKNIKNTKLNSIHNDNSKVSISDHSKKLNSHYTVGKDGIYKTTLYLPKTKIKYDSQGNMIVDNKRLNFEKQTIKKYKDNSGLTVVEIKTEGINKKKNTLYLDKKGIIPQIGQCELPGGFISHLKLSNDNKKVYYVSRYDDLFIVDINKIEHPKVLSKTHLSNISNFIISKDENRLYVNDAKEIAIYDISDKSSPKKLSSFPSKKYYRGMAVDSSESKLFVVKYGDKKSKHSRRAIMRNKLAIIDIRDKSHPKEIKDIIFPETIWDPYIYNNRLYLSHDVPSHRFSVIDIASLKVKTFNVGLDGIYKMSFNQDYLLATNNFKDTLKLFQINGSDIRKLTHIQTEVAWHLFYKWIRDIQVTHNGNYIVLLVDKNYISFKRFDIVLPDDRIDKDYLYDKDNYFGYQYSAVIQPKIDKLEGFVLSNDGNKLYAYSSSNLFLYDIRSLNE